MASIRTIAASSPPEYIVAEADFEGCSFSMTPLIDALVVAGDDEERGLVASSSTRGWLSGGLGGT